MGSAGLANGKWVVIVSSELCLGTDCGARGGGMVLCGIGGARRVESGRGRLQSGAIANSWSFVLDRAGSHDGFG